MTTSNIIEIAAVVVVVILAIRSFSNTEVDMDVSVRDHIATALTGATYDVDGGQQFVAA